MPDARASAPEEVRPRCHVLIPLKLDGAYDYGVPAGLALELGSFVVVPLGTRQVAGVVWGWGSADSSNAVADARLKDVLEVLAVPAMAEVTREFIDWVARYTCSRPGSVLRMAMSVTRALEAPAPVIAYALDGPPPERLTAARARVLDLMLDGKLRSAREIVETAGVGASVVRGLKAAGTLTEHAIARESGPLRPDATRPGPRLSEAQRAAAEAMVGLCEAGDFSIALLDGVTGAGKTEVYFEAIAAALAGGRQVLVLLPEIALTSQWLGRFEERFAAAPTMWHSELKASQRRFNWRAVADGRARVVVGARSALFLPYCELGLIVVDEEHDAGFKQEDGVIYHARDMAVARASLGRMPIVLASATPSLESLTNVAAGRYQRIHLPERATGAALPEIEGIDMRADPPARGEWLSPRLISAVRETLGAGEQSLLFLNRRGYAPLTLCRSCGFRFGCPNCATWLVEHRFQNRLQCHHCGYSLRMPEVCEECGGEHSFAACGPGVERLFEEAAKHFPGARAMIIASDTVHGPESAREAIRRIAECEVDLIIGTQIVAKGHHFPLLTLVGVVDADLGVAGGDLRAAERTYQLMTQVAGRAGRAEHPGRALLQTYMPQHPVMQALISGEREAFVERESEARRAQGLPPFGRLVALIVSGPDQGQVADVARALAACGPRGPGLDVLGPAPAPLHLLRGRFRHRLLLKAARKYNASSLAQDWVDRVNVPASVRVAIDVDPYSFL